MPQDSLDTQSACFVWQDKMKTVSKVSLTNKQPPGSHLMSSCTYGVYEPRPPSALGGHKQHKSNDKDDDDNDAVVRSLQ